MTSGSQHSFSSDRSPCFSIESAGALEHTFTETFPALAQPAVPQIPAETGTDWVNAPLARSLDLDSAWLRSDDGVRWLTGTEHAGQELQALGYSGFQFGQLSPVLGDGRAHLLGEWVTRESAQGALSRIDLHLKGSGLTPFSRQGSDGKAPLSAVWREAVIGEFLHATGVPTSRALAVLSTGERIRRRAPQPEPAGILVRTASSHLRVGTFQFAQMQRSAEERMALVEYALRRHYPEVKTGESTPNNPALALLRGVAQRQAKLVAQWMGLGFIHGVLNTDNVSISGEAIDFGPCAFMDIFKRDAVFSSIDQQGRYAYRNQPVITQWNLARFGETLLDLIDPEEPNRAVEQATEVLAEFGDIYRFEHTRVFAEKLGIERDGSAREQGDNEQGDSGQVAEFVEQTLTLLEETQTDFTGFFRALTENPADATPGNQTEPPVPLANIVGDAPKTADWYQHLTDLRRTTGTTAERAQKLMENVNPVYIPRNIQLDAALREVERGNTEPIEELIDAVRAPFERRPGMEYLEGAPTNSRFFRSFCGT